MYPGRGPLGGSIHLLLALNGIRRAGRRYRPRPTFDMALRNGPLPRLPGWGLKNKTWKLRCFHPAWAQAIAYVKLMHMHLSLSACLWYEVLRIEVHVERLWFYHSPGPFSNRSVEASQKCDGVIFASGCCPCLPSIWWAIKLFKIMQFKLPATTVRMNDARWQIEHTVCSMPMLHHVRSLFRVTLIPTDTPNRHHPAAKTTAARYFPTF